MIIGLNFTRFHYLLKSIFILVLFAFPVSGFAQYDYEHYVPPFYNGSSVPKDIGYHRAILSTNSVKDITVYIYRGYDDLIDQVTISNQSPKSYAFYNSAGDEKGVITKYPHTYDFPENVVGAKELNKVLTSEGLRFYSPDAPFFVNMRHSTKDQGSSLTTKGTYAYGTEFLSGHVYTDKNSATHRRSHFISVMAIEDNTLVNFSNIKVSGLTEFNSTTNQLQAQSVDPTTVITRTLNKGESYIVGVDHDLSGFQDKDKNAMNGTSVTSSKPIVVNSGSWTAGPSGQDIGVDQIVPIDQVRNEYIILRGKGNSTTERPIIVATEDNVSVEVNGSPAGTIAKKGDYLILNDPYDVNGNAYILTDKNVYVYQTLSGSSSKIGPTVGMNFIPPVSTSGIREVTVPYAEILAKQSVNGVITILTQTGAVVSYSKDGDKTLYPISDIVSSTTQIAGVPQWEIYKLDKNLTGSYRFYSNKAINVAWLVESGVVGAAGYYSGFTKEISKILPELDVYVDGKLDLICESYDDKIQVSIKDPRPDYYEWYVNDFKGDPINPNGPLLVDAPNEETSYYVVGSYRDPAMDQLFNGSFFEKTVDSDYSEVHGNLRNPGEYTTVRQTTEADPSFKYPAFTDMDNDYMFMAISDNYGDIIYRGTSVDVVDGFNYIVKLYGRSVDDKASYTSPQNLKIMVNDDVIVDNFKVEKTNEWQSVSALWKPKGASNAILKILNNNSSGIHSAFALDSITLVQAVQDTAVFVARVVPNYSYSNSGKTFQFCEAVRNSLDVSNGDTSWYKYSWAKKEKGTENYIDLEDVVDELSGTKTHELIFLDPQQENEGDYRCTISFKEEYKQCGSSSDNVHADLSVLVDRAATVKIRADKTNFCFGTTATLDASVTGDAGQVKWYVNGAAYPDFVGNPFVFAADNPAGIYTVRCEAENGCGLASDEITLNVLSAPELTALTPNTDLCEGDDIIITADATGDGILVYSWKEGTTDLAETGSILTVPATMDNRESIFSVSVSSVYSTAGSDVVCHNDAALSVRDLDVVPLVTIDDPLDDVTLCEGTTTHTFGVGVSEANSYYKFVWEKDGTIDTETTGGQKIISPIATGDEGTYKVTVSNRCDSEVSVADLIVVAKMVVTDITTDETGPFCNPTNVTVTFNDNGAVAEYKAIKPDGTEISITNPYTFEVNTTNEGSWQFIAVPNCGTENFTHEFTWNIIPEFGALTIDDIGTCLGENVSFVAKVEEMSALSEIKYSWTNEAGAIVGTDETALAIDNVEESDLGIYTCTVSDQCNSKTESATLSMQKVNTPNTASDIPPLCEGEKFRLDIDYVGTPTFQWYFSDINSASIGNNDYLEIDPVSKADEGVYYCVIHLICGSDVTIQRKLTVNEHISIVSPADETFDICENVEQEFNIEIDGDEYTLEWYDDSNNHIADLDNKTLVKIDALAPRLTPYTYTAKVTSLGGCDYLEKKYIVQVHEKPILSTLVNSVEKCAGLVELNITESGEHNGISWWKDAVEITDGNAEPTDFVIDLASSSDNGIYTAKVNAAYCPADSVLISVDITNNIVVTAQSDATTTICEDGTISLFVTANAGDDKIDYKWTQTDHPAKEFPNSPIIELKHVKIGEDDGEYTCELSNDLVCGNKTLTFNVNINKNPSITDDPKDRTVCETEISIDFTVVADAEGGPNYKWYNSKGEILGATNATFTETNLLDGETYYCEVTGKSGDCGKVISKKATLTIIKEVAVTNPLDQNIADGANAKFGVVATGEPNYTYQWQENSGSGWNDIFDGGKYSGAKTSELLITNALKADFDGNQYRCVVNSDGTVCGSNAISNAAILTINSVNKISAQPEDQVVCEGENIVFEITGTKATGLTYQWQYHNGDNNFIDAYSESDVLVSTYTVPNATQAMESWGVRCIVSDGISTGQPSNEVSVDVWENIVVTTLDNPGLTACVDAPFSITVEATGENLKYKWYEVGEEATVLSTSATFSIAKVTTGDEATYKVDVYNDQNCNKETRTFVVDVLELATVSDPADWTMCSTEADPDFIVSGGGDDISYQWYNSSGSIVGATGNSYTENHPVDGESYYCEVSNVCNIVTSKSAVLTVVEPLTVTDPDHQSIADNGTAHFSVTASGEPNYTYQWQVWNGSGWDDLLETLNYSNVNTAELTVSKALIGTFNGKEYRCKVTSDGGVCDPEVFSDKAILNITTDNHITAQPLDQKLCEGDPVTFTVGTVAAVDTYNWFYNDGTGDQPADPAWVSGGQLTIDPVTTAMNGWEFYCKVAIGTGTAKTTNKVDLTIWEKVSIVAPAVDITEEVCKGVSRNLSVTADGDEIEYKWYVSGTPGDVLSTTSSYYVDEINTDIVYECEVSNTCKTERRIFTFTVRDELAINTQPSDFTICEGEPIPEFSVTASGYAPLSYQWLENGIAVTAVVVDGNKYTPATAIDGNTYYCIITDACGNSLTSDVAELIVNQGVTITSQPADITISDGENATFELTATGDEISGVPITYQWQVWNGSDWDDLVDDATYSGSNLASLTITTANTLFNNNQYRCLVSNTCSTDVASATATLTVNALIKIFTQPTNLQACENEDVKFEIIGTNSGFTYEWQYDEGSGFAVAVGNHGMIASVDGTGKISTLTVPNVTTAMNSWAFRCIVKDGSSADETSNEVKVEVFEPVVFDPVLDQDLCFDESKQITLNVTSGTTPLTYSWMKDATTEVSTTTMLNIGADDNGDYKVIVGNGGICPDKSSNFTVYHHEKLSLNAWANGSEMCTNNSQTLSVSINNIDPTLSLTYKWYKDNVEIPLENTDDYTFTPSNKSESGQYKVEVSDGCSTESVSGYVNVFDPIARVNNWDKTTELCLGDELNLEVQLTGDVKSYAWTHQGATISSATTSYLISSLSDTDAGTYICTVTDNCGNSIEYKTELTVIHTPEITLGIEDLSAICEGKDLEMGSIVVNGSFDNITWQVPAAVSGTVEDDSKRYYLGAATTTMEGNYKVTVKNKCGEDVSVGAQVVNPTPTLESIADKTVCQWEDVVFRAKATGRSLHYKWYIDDVETGVTISALLMSGSDVLPADAFTPGTYTIKCVVTNDNSCGEELTETAQLTVDPATILNTTLANDVKFVGEDYDMTVDITGHKLTYSWTHEKDGVITPLAVNGPTISFKDIQLSDAGYYHCTITGSCGTRLASGKLTVKEPVVIVEGLADLEEKCEGEPLSLNIDATGQVNNVVWKKGETVLPFTDLNLYIPELTTADAGVYTCIIEGEGAPAGGIIQKITVRVYENTTLIAPLGNRPVCEGEMLSWTPNVTGAKDIQFEWYFEGVKISDDKTLNYTSTEIIHEGDYEVQVTGVCGDVSTTGSLEVTELPKITSISESDEVCENESLVEFSVEATGEKLKYQWQKDGVDIPGKTSPVLSLTSIQLNDDASYTCEVSNYCTSVISDKMTLTVIAQLRILSEIADIEVCSNEEVTLVADVEGNDVTYQWKLDGVDISGETSSVYHILESDPLDNGYYTCIVSDRCTDSRSTKPTELIVHELPNTAIFGRMKLCAKEDRVTYVTNQVNENEYGWDVDGGIFAGPQQGLRTRVTWGEEDEGQLSIYISDVATGCESKVDSVVVLHALPTVNLAAFESKGVCEESFTLSGGYPEGGIYWVDDISEEVFDPADKGPGTYNIHYSYTDENGCSNVTGKTIIQVDALPVVNITDDTTIGSCKPFTLTAKTNENNIQWSPATNLDDANSMSPIFTPGESQVLIATVMDEHGCTNMDLVELTVAPLPVVSTIPDTTVGQCNQLKLLTDIVGNAEDVSWTNADHLDDPYTRSPKIINAPEGTYTYKINVTDLYGCNSEDEVIVHMVADPKLDEDVFACEGDQFQVNIADMDNPIWNDGYADEARIIDQPGKYLLTVENEHGCGDQQRFVINPTPKLDLRNNLIFDGPKEIELLEGRPVTIHEGQSVIIAPNLPLEYSPYFFEWQDGTILQRYEASETGTYELKVRDNLGCVAVDSVSLEVKPVGLESPNAFTPNSNNENDRFYLKDINYDIEKYEMYVYNRWGELLYKTDQVGRNGGWDGKYNGKMCPSGAYVWMVFINGELTNKGTFMLIR
ncbi:T9SS type B sorting domain-containing protein [Marinifilum sp.]|uniref:Ig-like domain-containing protein n=1 Tax=Marinifilum sp. TaxID=2033137 RepID=UPI003BA90021